MQFALILAQITTRARRRGRAPRGVHLLAGASTLLYCVCVSQGQATDLGDYIRQQRQRANLSLRRLADRAGISNPYLSQIERGIRRPSAQILKQLSRALSISAETMYSRAGLIEDGGDPPTVVEAIESDQKLSARQKQVLLDLYRALIENPVHKELE